MAVTGGASNLSLAQQSPSLPLAAGTVAKLVDSENLAKLMTANPAGRYRVIIQYANSELGAPNANGSKQDDEQFIARNHARQDALLKEVFGSAEAMISGPLAQQYETKRFDYSPLVAMSLTAAEVDRLAANTGVIHIQPDIPVPPTLDQSTEHVNMPAVWNAGGTGAGRTVAILDTGVKKEHEFITSGRVVSEACYNLTYATYNSTSRCPGGSDTSVAAGSGADCSASTASGCSHGTHVAGIAAGNNTNRQSGEPARGMAYQANIIAINVFAKFDNNGAPTPSCNTSPCVLSYTSDQIAGLERVYALRTTYAIDAVNMSIGGGAYSAACDSDSRTSIITNLRNAGIATVIAAGNDGLDTQVGAPGCISAAITVASSLDNADSRSSFSNWGNLIDVVAPGSDIRSSVYGSSVADITSYSDYNGTSMATPHVVGAFAALRDLFPAKTVTEIENALESTGAPITSAGVTKPRINMLAACNALGAGTCSGPSGPPNDNFANAVNIATLPRSLTGTNVLATAEAGEPVISAPNNTVWYRVTLASAATLHIDTENSSLDTVIALYSGSSVGGLTQIALDDDGGVSNLSSMIEVNVPAGTYRIAVDGYQASTGTFNLNVSAVGAWSGALYSSVRFGARATTVGNSVGTFADIFNASSQTATGCSVALPGPIAGTTLFYQPTNLAGSAIGSPNTPINIAPNARQRFYFALRSNVSAYPNIALRFDCTNTPPVPTTYGVNSFIFLSSPTAVADMPVSVSTAGNTGYISIPGQTGTATAIVAARNAGATQMLTALVTEKAVGGVDPNMAAQLSICRSNASGVCVTPFSGVTPQFSAVAGQTYYFVIRVKGTGTVANIPLRNRAHIYLRNPQLRIVGATNVGVRTN